MFKTPILFLIFNRPDTTERVFAEIRKQKPKYLYIAADGARANKEGEAEKCEQTRKLVLENIDWGCEVKTLFRDKNLGCGLAVSGAISWFFENVEQGIILEDDCLPNESFFGFCEELLGRYKDNEDILSISGFNFGYNPEYIFTSNFMNMWGWATWKRSAHAVDYFMNTWKAKNFQSKKYFLIRNLSRKLKYNQCWVDYWWATFDKIAHDDDRLHTWDYQWIYYALSSKKKTIFSNINYIKNIGFGTNATHTTDESNLIASMKSSNQNYSKIINLKPDMVYEEEFVKKIWCSGNFENDISIPYYVIKYIVKKVLVLLYLRKKV